MRLRYRSLLIAFSLTLSGPVFAGDIDNIVVTGTRTSELLSEIPNTTTVIRLDQIEARNDSGIVDLLRDLPGIHIIQPSGQGGVARVFLRGGDPELTMVLLDGVRVNDPNDSRGSAFDFSSVNLNDVERIEIVRGPQSAVYGSDALAGVINIISKGRAEELAASVFAEVGTDDYLRGSLEVVSPVGNEGGFSVRLGTTDDGKSVVGSTFTSDSASAKLSFGDVHGWDLRIFGSLTDSDSTSFPADSGGAELAVIRKVDTRSADSLRFGLNGKFTLADIWRFNILASWYDHDAEFLSPGVAPGVRDPVPPNGADSSLRRADLAANAIVKVGEYATVTFGFDYYDENGTSDGFVEFAPGLIIPAGFESDRRVTGAFGELHYKSSSGPTILASVRHDDPDQERGKTTAKFGVLQEFNAGRTGIRANWGQGFSLPGFFALASPLVGNPDLRPQTSRSLDIGITRWSADRRVRAMFTLFHNQFSDLIDFDTTIFSMVNRDRLEAKGIEMLVDISVNDRLSLQAQATYLDTEIDNSTTPVKQRPDWRGGLSLRWSPSTDWLVDASWLSVGSTFDSSIPTGDMFLDGYDRVDVTATYRPSQNMQVLLAVDNLFNEDYREAIGFPAPGARARLGLRYRF